MSKRCLIISGGEYSPFPAPEEDVFVIACDRGYDYACRCGVKPDLVLGDFDSCRSPVAEDLPVETLPAEKDDTDTMHALRRALELGCTDIALVCALGGRLDHLLANLQTAVFAARQGAGVRIVKENLLPHRKGFGEG